MQEEMFKKSLLERAKEIKAKKEKEKPIPVGRGEKLVQTTGGRYFKIVDKYSEANYKLGIPQFTMKEMQVIHRNLEAEGRDKLTDKEAEQLFTLKLLFKGTVIENKTMREMKQGKVLSAIEAKERIREMREMLKTSTGLTTRKT